VLHLLTGLAAMRGKEMVERGRAEVGKL
jgi:hypothetical protein